MLALMVSFITLSMGAYSGMFQKSRTIENTWPVRCSRAALC